MCNVHHITKEDVVIKLLVTSLKGKAMKCFRTLHFRSIDSWDALGDALTKFLKINIIIYLCMLILTLIGKAILIIEKVVVEEPCFLKRILVSLLRNKQDCIS